MTRIAPPSTADLPLPPPHDDYRRQIDAVVDDLEALIRGLDAASFNWSPDACSWSIGQCLDHLSTVDRAYGRRLERVLEAAVARGSAGGRRSHRRGWSLLERLAITAMEPPPRPRLPAPRSITPASELDPEIVCPAFRAEQQRLARLLEEAREVDLSALKVASPILPVLRFSAGAAFGFLAAHDRRHLWQAWTVRRHADFPA